MPAITMDPLDLAAVLCSRICHDVINPVGAIQNGLELMAEEKDSGLRDDALDLIGKSAASASAKLKFARIAYGASGSAGASLDMGDAHSAAVDLIVDNRTTLDWKAPRVLLPKNKVKLLLNLLILAAQSIPRGGSIEVIGEIEGETCRYAIRAKGPYARVPAHTAELLAGESETGTVDAEGVRAYYAGLVARACGMSASIELIDDAVTVLSAPLA
ncbi:histidine phosphotransferase ChpT [Terrarubrum flagellatum]|uniref:histidine phosphotransferase ChpT n=1 Tax=Terrirubrum flagellatum TaxID=2895980 RepID=UPI003145417C